MTSEVLMMNREAVVIAADSAVTTTTANDAHPRYSKAANKIFDISGHGNVAATIYETASVDGVPWALALRLFRNHDAGNAQRPLLEDYRPALLAFLQGNTSLFPPQTDLLQKRFAQAAVNILERAERHSPGFADVSQPVPVRQAAWAAAEIALKAELAPLAFQHPLDVADQTAIAAQTAALQAEFGPKLAATPRWSPADLNQLTSLAIENLVKRPTEFMAYTGLVLAGYGTDQIFPRYVETFVYGHVGSKLLVTDGSSFQMTHESDALIKPFAQSSMIDRFTDGFDWTLAQIIDQSSIAAFKSLTDAFAAAGHAVPQATADPLITSQHTAFKNEWRQKNWNKNFFPLRRVLNGLSVSEMGHLAESLLVVESLRERVTSSTETVGGPIDVAVITKTEGLIWIKRKHFFDPALNLRYLNRAGKH